MKQDEEIEVVARALDIALEKGMATEVVWSAMRTYAKYHKSAPETYNMEWAFEAALNDWDL